MATGDESVAMKVVGRRKPCGGGLLKAAALLQTVCRLRGDRPFIPRGVYRFRSHEEANAWSIRMMARPKS